MSTPQSSARSSMPPIEVTASVRRRASPFPAPSAAMSERTPVEVSAWTAAMIAVDVDRLPPVVLDRDDLGAAPGRDVGHALAEEPVDRDHDDVAGVHGVDE